MRHGLKTATVEPAPYLFIDRSVREQVVGQHAPMRAAAHQSAQRIEYLAQIVPALSCVQRQLGQIGGDEFPFFVADITWITLTGFHLRNGLPNRLLVHSRLSGFRLM